jgi:hypothetical protein
MKHRLVEDFVVAHYNRTVNLDLQKKDKNGTVLTYIMYTADFNKLKPTEIVSYSSYRFAGGDYSVVKRDDRFLDIEELMDKYSGILEALVDEKVMVERKLYSSIMILMREGRINGDFKLRPVRDAQLDSIASKFDKAIKLLDNLEKRTKNLEELAERGRVPR